MTKVSYIKPATVAYAQIDGRDDHGSFAIAVKLLDNMTAGASMRHEANALRRKAERLLRQAQRIEDASDLI